jgi:hypothetical protein
MKPASALRRTLIVLGSLFGCLVVGLIIWIALRSLPSADAKELLAKYGTHPTLPDSENADVYIWGLVAPADVDPATLGARRIAWLRQRSDDIDKDTPDPGGKLIEAKDLRSASMQKLADICSKAVATPCTAAFDEAVATAIPTADEQRVLARYRRLLEYPGYAEAVPFDDEQPLPPYEFTLDAQRLGFIELAQAADRGDAAAVRDGLERGAAFWRRVQRDADGLIPKMFAGSALRNEFFFGNRILRRLPVESMSDAIPPSWRRALDAEELSMGRVLAGEFAFANRAMRRRARELEETYTVDGDDEEYEPQDAVDRVLAGIGRRVNPPQSYLNRMAAVYLSVSRAYTGPLHDYDAIDERLRTESPDYTLIRIDSYAFRVATIEGQRRAALLAAELRANSLAHDQVGVAVSAHALRDPFTRAPFVWAEADGTLTFQGPKANGRRRTQIYLY